MPAPTPSLPVLTGFGALDSDWDARHKSDTDFLPGSVYDPDPRLPAIDAHTGARYTEVEHMGGRVVLYTMHQYPRTDIEVALAAVKGDLPGDAKLVWNEQKDSCVQYQFQSAALAQALGALDPDGGVLVELTTFANGRGYFYSSTDVGQAMVTNSFDATADTAGGC